MKRIITILLLILCASVTQQTLACAYAAMPDSIAPDPEDEDFRPDTVARNPRRTATGQSILGYSLETRHRPEGEEFTGKWYDHLYLEAGIGLMGIAGQSDNYRTAPLATVHGGLAKTFGRLHTVRLSLTAGLGKEKPGSRRFHSLAGKADYLFNLTAYSKGYNPARRFETSLLLGAGMMLTKLKGQPKRISPEVHGGLQFKVVTNPYACIMAEPYVGVTMDKMDYSTDNWRKYDVFYGINLSVAHYLSDNYAPRQRRDSLLRAPWFVEAAMGPSVFSGKSGSIKSVPAMETMGLRMSWAVGKWFSPVVGMKLSAFMASNRMARETVSGGYGRNSYVTSCGAQLDAMINPFGFSKRFSWDAPFGAYLLGGVGGGMLNRSKSEKFVSASIGAHLYASIDRDLQLFVEPRYSEYRHSGLRDRNASVLVGLTATARGMKYRPHTVHPEGRDVSSVPVTAGLSLTVPVMMMQGKAYAGGSLSYGMKAFGHYRFTEISAVRLSVDWLSLSRAADSPYLEEYMDGDRLVSRSRYGFMNRRHGLLVATAGYSLDVCRLLGGCRLPRRFGTELYFGPGATFCLSDKVTAPDGMNLPEGHEVKSNTRHTVKACFTFTGGVKLSHNFSGSWGIYLEPSLHAVMNMKMAGMQTISLSGSKMQIIPSVSLGAQYTL
ncbi:MAG: hypothetical protein NC344_02975 [Bacteroidales bacterium]|nr:hypothetical protein [Bacteroidales bacterium]MCM1146795.1 hypothetical protein [Bacteroidales bacterium]MCM1205708.1 hypothetical protein [Bacillota bacterium]MCM1510762.1 hypothetical protein [Clostridium sp.]